MTKDKVKIGICFAADAFFVLFIAGIINRFKLLNIHGFKVSEYWAIVAFGVTISTAIAVYAAIRLAILFRALKRPPEDEEKPEGNETEPSVPSAVKTETTEEEKKNKKLTRSEKRREKLLSDDEQKIKKKTDKGIVCIAIIAVFCAIYAAWAFFPCKISFHNYSYDTSVNPVAGIDEITNYRFYSDYLGRPYYLYAVSSEKDIRVNYTGKEKGSDERGEYVKYTFYGEEKYAKILDCALNRHTTATCSLTVYSYADSVIKIEHHAEKTRNGVTEKYDYSGKYYRYK